MQSDPATQEQRPRSSQVRRRVRQVAAITALLAVIFLVADLAAGCYYAIKINSDGFRVNNDPPELDLTVETAGEDRITLRHSGDGSDLEHPSVWGVETPTGYGRVGRVVEVGDTTVTREYALLEGTVTAGQKARLDRYAFAGDPLHGRGLAFEEVAYDSPLGPMPAWYVPGRTNTWVILVHGMGARRAQALRALGPVVESGAHSMVVAYRNDAGSPADPSRKYQYGRTEWQDVEAAAHYARNHGASRIVVAGFSMGGSITMSFMRNSALAPEVSGIILDAPMLDFSATVDFAGRERGLPGFLTWTAKRMVGLRYGVAWDEMDYLRDADGLTVPVLLIHGEPDEKVPISTSRALAAKLPDSVQLEVFPDAQHVGAWNSEPERYERLVRGFLDRAAR